MNQKPITKDEQYLVKLHQMAMARGDTYEEVDRYAVGQALGLHDRMIDNIVRHLAQANFIKKSDENNIYLTPHGFNLVNTLLEEHF